MRPFATFTATFKSTMSYMCAFSSATRYWTLLALVLGLGLGLRAENFTSVVVGGDPGGSALLRVGGSFSAVGGMTVGSPSNINHYLFSDATDHYPLRVINAGSRFRLYQDTGIVGLQATTANEGAFSTLNLYGSSVTVGSDPGGTELMRVGGAFRATGSMNIGSTSNINHYIYSDATDHYPLRVINAGSRFRLYQDNGIVGLQATTANESAFSTLNLYGTSVTVGSDPGGSEMMRVGGAFKAIGSVNVGSPSNINHYIYSDAADHYPLRVVNAGSRFRLYQDNGIVGLQATTANEGAFSTLNLVGASVTVGSDPGGAELMRVGGAFKATGSMNIGSTSNVNHYIYSDAADHYPLRVVNAGSRFRLYQDNGIVGLQATTANEGAFSTLNLVGASVTVGSDPGGTELMRVGGGAAFNGAVRAKEVRVENTGWGDYVFAPDYKLLSLGEVAQHIADKHHLPGIPSAAEIAKDGLGLSDMVTKQMVKIEELTLYAIEVDRRIKEVEIERDSLKERLTAIEKALADLGKPVGK